MISYDSVAKYKLNALFASYGHIVLYIMNAHRAKKRIIHLIFLYK